METPEVAFLWKFEIYPNFYFDVLSFGFERCVLEKHFEWSFMKDPRVDTLLRALSAYNGKEIGR